MKRLGWAILPTLLTGCVVGPNYEGPPGVASGERPGSTFRRADQAVTSPQPPVARWWEGMGDAQLTMLIDRALASNPDVAIAEARIPVLEPLMTHTLPRSMVESSVRNVYGDPARVTPALVDRYHELALREGNRGALVQRFRQSPGGEFTEQISRIKAPTLILWGGLDRLIPLENGQRFAREITGSQLVVFDALGHVPHEEDPVATVAAVQAFLDSH